MREGGTRERASEGERERERGRKEREGGGRAGEREREGGQVAARWGRGLDVDAMSAAGVDLTNFLKGWGRSHGFRRLG